MRERDESGHLAVGAGAPSDPDVPDPDEALVAPADDGQAEAGPHPTGDVVQAVAEFLDDLVDDPTFAHDPPQP